MKIVVLKEKKEKKGRKEREREKEKEKDELKNGKRLGIEFLIRTSSETICRRLYLRFLLSQEITVAG